MVTSFVFPHILIFFNQQVAEPNFEVCAKKEKKERLKLPTVARESLRYDVSLRATAAIVTATLIDINHVTKDTADDVVGHLKIYRERNEVMKDYQNEFEETLLENPVTCIIFDGKKDDTLTYLVDDKGKTYPGRTKEEHIAVSSEPGGKYLTHLSPDGGKAVNVGDSLVNWIQEHDIDSSLMAIGGDSTNVNTGRQGGIIQYVEKKLEKKLTWIICSLHTNELPLRHLIIQLDGPTSSDTKFTGTLGIEICKDVQDYEINSNFKKISDGPGVCELPPDVVQDLSTDQRYAYRIAQVIRSGEIDWDLVYCQIGPVVHSRWLTTACRFCRLYISKHEFKGKDLTNLKLIVHWIVTVYLPTWFQIKCNPRLVDGPKHILYQIQLIRAFVSKKVQAIIFPYVETGAWQAHSEIVLLSCLCDDDVNLRKFAVNKILEKRGSLEFGDTSVREFHRPIINKEASCLQELINWSDLHEPNFTCSLSTGEIINLVDNKLELPSYPNHGQSIERIVKEVSNAAKKVFGFERRDGYIRAKIKSRDIMPKQTSKKSLMKMIPGV